MLEQLTIWIDAATKGSLGNPFLAVWVYAAAGLVSSLFPCVYPLIPITVGFLQKRTGEGEPKWLHPLYYWIGTILTYAVLGAFAAVGGGAFNSIMKEGWVIILLGFLFLFLAFVMLDWFMLRLPDGSSLTSKASKHKGVLFTLAMGSLAGLAASACVTPALVAMLIFIAQSDPANLAPMQRFFTGALLSGAFGAGIGVPFFLSGIFGAKLPKSGRWMETVKISFAFLIAAVALYQIHKGFQVYGFTNMMIAMILSGVALIFVAVLLGLRPPEKSNRHELTKFYFALLMCAFGAALIIKGINANSTTKSELPHQVSALRGERESIGSLTFYRDPDEARETAFKENKPLFIDFYADWCTNCKDFQKLAAAQGPLNHALASAVLLKIKDTDPAFESYASDPNHRELRVGLPFFLIFSSSGELLYKSTNYRDSAGMIQAIHAATGGK